MKKRLNLINTLPLCLCVGLAFSARATITGQWDFKAGNYSATIGQPMYPTDQFATDNTRFGMTTALGIPGIAGVPTNVMQFPQFQDSYFGASGGSSTYLVPVSASANGNGFNVNQYTVIMDLLFTNTPAPGKTATLFGTDYNGFGGEFFVNSSGAVGYSGLQAGSLTPNVWHRVAIAVDLTNAASGLAIFIDGTKVLDVAPPSALDGTFSISSYINLFNDPNTNSLRGYLASLQFDDQKLADGLIAALGGPVASGILTGPPPSPWVVSTAPHSDLLFPGRSTVSPAPLIQIVLNDGAATVETNTIALKFNGSAVPASATYSAPTTTISYQVPTLLAAASRNQVSLSYQDSAGDSLGVQYAFDVGPYIALPTSAANPLGSANTRGFIFRVAQAPSDASLDGSLARAQKQLDGTLLNPTNGLPFGNEASLSGAGVQPDGSFFVDQYEGTSGTVAFSTHNPLGYPNVLPEFTTVYDFPGIPGTNGSIANFADDVLAYLPLNAGTYIFGVAVGATRVDTPPDNGYRLYCGANPRDYFATLVGQYVRNQSYAWNNNIANTNTFTFLAPVAGVYPFRLVHWQNQSEADLAWYYVDQNTGQNILINDPTGAIPAYRGSTVGREPYIAEISPTPGGQGFLATAPIVVMLSDDDLQVASGSIKLYLNGTQVTPNSIGKTNKFTTVTYSPNASRTTVTNNVQLVFSDNASPTAHSFTNSWSFTIVLAAAGVPPVIGQWDFTHGDLTATVGKDLKYLDGTNGVSATITAFGTCSSFGIPLINGVDAAVMKVPPTDGLGRSVQDYFGYIMNHQIAPNGGGTLVNQYTIIYDLYWPGSGIIPLFNCQNTNNAPADGSLFLQANAIGQGSYTMYHTNVSTGWHRIAVSVDLSQNLVTKWVDGVKAQDWVGSVNALDAPRRAWQPLVLLFADGDGDDHSQTTYVSSIQVRNGKLGDAQMVLLGGPSAGKIPQAIPDTSVTGQWDFGYGDLLSFIGKDLQYFDGPSGVSASMTAWTNCSTAGIPLLNGVDARVLRVPPTDGLGRSIQDNFGYVMDHQIAPNGGGTLVNQYTIIWDMYWPGGTGIIPFFNCQNTNNAPADGSLFLQNGAMGQGTYEMPLLPGGITAGWHRLAFAVDLSQNLITKWVDGNKAEDWVASANSLDTPRRAWQPLVLLFADGDGDDHSVTVYVKSIQVSVGKRSDAYMEALGGPSSSGIPVYVAAEAPPSLTVKNNGNGTITVSWPLSSTGWGLQTATHLNASNWGTYAGSIANNSATITVGPGAAFFRLSK